MLEQQEVIEVADDQQIKKQYKQLFLVYGTLRYGMGNWSHCLKGRSDHLGQMRTEPIFNMYSLGGFPAVAEHGETAILVDVFGTNDDRCIQSVNSLEGHICQGHPRNWYDTVTIDTQWGKAEMFIMNEKNGSSHRLVASGDWLTFIKNERY